MATITTTTMEPRTIAEARRRKGLSHKSMSLACQEVEPTFPKAREAYTLMEAVGTANHWHLLAISKVLGLSLPLVATLMQPKGPVRVSRPR